MHPGGGLKLEGTLPSRGGGFADIKLGLGRGKSVQSAIFFLKMTKDNHFRGGFGF